MKRALGFLAVLIATTAAWAFAGGLSQPTSLASLGLGTAATKNTGTTAGTVPILDGVGLPAVNGSQLTDVAAATLGGATFAAPGAVGSGTPATSVAVGASGATITGIRVYAASLTPTQIAAAIGAVEQAFTVTGLTTGDKVFVSGPTPTALCPLVGARASGTNQITLVFGNLAVALCTPVSGTYTIMAIRS